MFTSNQITLFRYKNMVIAKSFKYKYSEYVVLNYFQVLIALGKPVRCKLKTEFYFWLFWIYLVHIVGIGLYFICFIKFNAPINME